MVLKAFIPSGLTEITVNGLHQWDYGQQLEIHSEDLPSLIEVHFACMGMDMAVVRSCAVVNGVGVVTIPDQCLEQASPITAWVYEVDGSVGTTTKTILLNVMERVRPSTTAEDIPTAVVDKYTEAITAMNEMVAATDEKLDNAAEEVTGAIVAGLKSGEIEVSKAKIADDALTANRITLDWERFHRDSGIAVSHGSVIASDMDLDKGVYIFQIKDTASNCCCSCLLVVDSCSQCDSAKANLHIKTSGGGETTAEVYVQYWPDSKDLMIRAFNAMNSSETISGSFNIVASYQRIV